MARKNKTNTGRPSEQGAHLFYSRTVLEGSFIGGLNLPAQIFGSEEVDCELKPSSISLLMWH